MALNAKTVDSIKGTRIISKTPDVPQGNRRAMLTASDRQENLSRGLASAYAPTHTCAPMHTRLEAL
jgi:hypothetical protein